MQRRICPTNSPWFCREAGACGDSAGRSGNIKIELEFGLRSSIAVIIYLRLEPVQHSRIAREFQSGPFKWARGWRPDGKSITLLHGLGLLGLCRGTRPVSTCTSRR